MWDFLIAWRSELLTLLSLSVSWFIICRLWRKPFWETFFAGMLTGLCVEYMTEPEWTYNMQFYIWRDVSPFVIMGWGINFTWVILFSEKTCKVIFGQQAGTAKDKRLFITDSLIGVPYFLCVELIGLHVLKVWQYNAILNWNTMIPGIQYPIEGIIAIFLFSLTFPWMIRYWRTGE